MHNDRSTLPVNLTSETNIARLHNEGHLAVHITPTPTELYEKIDDRRILNNLREDGGTEDRPTDYQLYTIISATVLPPSQYPIEQRLYDRKGRIFVGMDIENSLIKHFNVVDSQSTYHFVNKRGRRSYTATFFLEDYSTVPPERRLGKIDHYNKATGEAAIKPSGDEDDIFGVEPPSYLRAMNEILLKVDNKSMICLGTRAQDVAGQPDVLLELIYLQQHLKALSGVEYPIYIYNNTKQAVSLDTVDATPLQITPNQFHHVEVEKVLMQIIRKYPDEIKLAFGSAINPGVEKAVKTQDVLAQIGVTRNANQEPVLKPMQQFVAEDLAKRQAYLLQINQVQSELATKIPPFQSEDEVIQPHHAKASPQDYYPEINQDKLSKFIKVRVLGLSENHTLSAEEKENHKNLMKAYNLQFRLEIYKELFESGSSVNYGNLSKDLAWFPALKLKLPTISETTSEQKLRSFKP